jgi:hypothetical protein
MSIINPGTALSTSSAFTLGGIFPVWDDGVKETIDSTGGNLKKTQSVRQLRTLWNLRNSLAVFLVGGSYAISGTPFYSFGQPYPYDPSLVCQKVEMAGDGLTGSLGTGNNQIIAYERAVVKATYVIPEWNFGSPNLTGTQELSFSSSAIALSSTTPSFQWSGSGNNTGSIDPSNVPALQIKTCNFDIARYSVPSINFNTILNTINCVNSGTFYGAAPGQALFVGGRSSRKITAQGAWNWDISFSFQVKASGRIWNELFGPQGWQKFTDMNGNPFWPSADFSQLYV